MTDDLRARVIAMVEDVPMIATEWEHAQVRALALAVAALVAEECARECESHQANCPDDPLANSFDGACRHNADAIRQRAERLR